MTNDQMGPKSTFVEIAIQQGLTDRHGILSQACAGEYGVTVKAWHESSLGPLPLLAYLPSALDGLPRCRKACDGGLRCAF